MSDLANELKSKLSEFPSIHEAIVSVSAALISNVFAMGLKARSKSIENDHFEGSITNAEYKTVQVNLTKSLFYLIDQLTDTQLKDILNEVDVGGNGRIKTILYLAASPKELEHLQTENEYAVISKALESSANRQNFNFESPVFATTIDQMIKYINIYKPNIIHFSGHAGRNGIVLSDNNNNVKQVPLKILDSYFETFNKTIDCVFLNACYSAKQASIISQHVKYVIGMNYPIGDETAILFSESFYQGIFNDDELNYEKAFKQAKITLLFKRNREGRIPEIWKEMKILA